MQVWYYNYRRREQHTQSKEDKKMTIKKHFQYKGQMINYFNKVKANPNIEFCVMYLGEGGYTVEYKRG